MIREFAVAVLVPAAGCSLALDFSDQAIPRDAAVDAFVAPAACRYKEPNDSIAAAAPVAAADTGPAAICAGAVEDHDFYAVAVPAMTRLEIRLDYAFRPGGDLDLRLYDGEAMPPVSRGFGDEEVITCPGAAPACPTLAAGSYVFEVFPAETGDTNTYTFAVELTPL